VKKQRNRLPWAVAGALAGLVIGVAVAGSVSDDVEGVGVAILVGPMLGAIGGSFSALEFGGSGRILERQSTI
jgi:hypothetical protein